MRNNTNQSPQVMRIVMRTCAHGNRVQRTEVGRKVACGAFLVPPHAHLLGDVSGHLRKVGFRAPTCSLSCALCCRQLALQRGVVAG
jgi:hypothetical protein